MSGKHRDLTKEELKYIFDFCKKWDVEYVDLRLELVDHMASQITDLWKENPNLTFKEAFHQVYKSFGIFGLLNVVEDHRNIVYRKYWHEIKKGFAEWVTPPRIIATLLMGVVFFLIYGLVPKIIAPTFIVLLSGLFIAGFLLVIRSHKLTKFINGETTMLLSAPRLFLWALYFIYVLPFQSFYHAFLTSDIRHTNTCVAVATFVTIFSVLFVLVNFKILQIAKSQIMEMRKQLAGFV